MEKFDAHMGTYHDS